MRDQFITQGPTKRPAKGRGGPEGMTDPTSAFVVPTTSTSVSLSVCQRLILYATIGPSKLPVFIAMALVGFEENKKRIYALRILCAILGYIGEANGKFGNRERVRLGK